MHCFHCGAALTPGTFFCPECGRRVVDGGAPAPDSMPPAVPPPIPDADESTVIRPRVSAPARPFVLVATTGQRFEVTGRSLLGRNPKASTDALGASVLVVVDPGKTISKSHAELLVVAGELLVVDLGSGNGTIVETPGSAPVRCEPGLPQPVPRGSRLVLGRQAIDVH